MDRPVEDSGEVPDTMGTKMPEVVGGDPVRVLRPSHLDLFYGINCVGWTETGQEDRQVLYDADAYQSPCPVGLGGGGGAD